MLAIAQPLETPFAAGASAFRIAPQLVQQISHCLHSGCVISIQHSPIMAPRFTPWQLWGAPSYYSGNIGRVLDELENCHRQRPQDHIRLDIEDFNCHSRFSLVVYSPS
ncbi:MAG: ribulose bisphosphate carboxylase small subunit [Gammaproteobacteria bacterium]|nr:ribulose bisphosphate carboxylase small subunit [Gammaproteobacteria bacterium]